MSMEKRFKYDECKRQEKTEELRLIKVKQLRQKKEKADDKKKKPEGYTFPKQKRGEEEPRDIPAPDHYSYSPEWAKKSFNMNKIIIYVL